MKKCKIFIVLTVLILAMSLMLVACGDTDSSDGGTALRPEPPEGDFSNNGDNLGGGGVGTLPDQVDDVSTDVFTFSDLSELSGNVDYSGATALTESETAIEITESGSYVLSGNYSGGITVSVGNKESVHLFLNGANVSNSNGIAISNTNKKSSLIITLVDGTQNTVSNAGEDVNAIHVKGESSVNGSGKLTVVSQSKNAIKVSKGLFVVDANIVIESANHGVSARFVEAQNATITVNSAAKDGVNAECDDDTTTFPSDYSEGYVALKNVAYSCDVQGDGIQADTLVYIEGGSVNIKTNGTFVKYSQENIEKYGLSDDDFRYKASGSGYQKIASDSNNRLSSLYALTQSCKGIKVGEIDYEDESGNEIKVTEGKYLIVIKGECEADIRSTDDAIHTNSGDVIIAGGNITINTCDDGITSDMHTQITGGTIVIESSYEGVEGAYVTISGGKLDIVSSDDGINAASDDTSIKEYIVITGGEIVVDAEGDGLDSNGSIRITGGTIIVHGPTNGGDGALDADSGIIVQGGMLYAASTLGMVETPSTNSTQYVLSYAQNSAIASGTVLAIKDSNGTELFSMTVEKDCQSIIISLSQFQSGQTYSVYSGDTQLATFTISDVITRVGVSMGGGQGGFGGPDGGFGGGGQNPPQKPQ